MPKLYRAAWTYEHQRKNYILQGAFDPPGRGNRPPQGTGHALPPAHPPATLNLVRSLKTGVQNNRPLSEIITAQTDALTPFEIALISAGEHSGKLDITLARLADYFEIQQKYLGRLKSGLLMPGIYAGIFLFLIPFIFWLLSPNRSHIDLLTNLAALALILAGLATLVRLARKNESVRVAALKFLINVPYIGPMIKKFDIMKFTQGLHCMVDAGADLPPGP